MQVTECLHLLQNFSERLKHHKKKIFDGKITLTEQIQDQNSVQLDLALKKSLSGHFSPIIFLVNDSQ